MAWQPFIPKRLSVTTACGTIAVMCTSRERKTIWGQSAQTTTRVVGFALLLKDTHTNFTECYIYIYIRLSSHLGMMIIIILRKLILIITLILTQILNLSRLNPKDTLLPLSVTFHCALIMCPSLKRQLSVYTIIRQLSMP